MSGIRVMGSPSRHGDTESDHRDGPARRPTVPAQRGKVNPICLVGEMTYLLSPCIRIRLAMIITFDFLAVIHYDRVSFILTAGSCYGRE